MWQPGSTIPLTQPHVGERELEYVSDAVRQGWNRHHRDYLDRFEEQFARYVGARFAVAVNSGAAAQHLALLGLGIGPGDEVIVPDHAFVSAANVCRYVGATPVFADVEPQTWCLDPTDVRRLITDRTRAIMPVYACGTPPDMAALMELARSHGLLVVEDAAPAVGTTVNGRPAGSFGEVAAFSFQESKIMVTGEGGMLTTNDATVAERARRLSSHGTDSRRAGWYPDIGYMYRLSNVQAALGVAQLERIEEFVTAKRRVFSWYQQRLNGIPGLSMNVEREGVRNNYSLISLVLWGKFAVTRDELVTRLKERLVEARPFFLPISCFPMYGRKYTPVAAQLGANGLSLPAAFCCRRRRWTTSPGRCD